MRSVKSSHGNVTDLDKGFNHDIGGRRRKLGMEDAKILENVVWNGSQKIGNVVSFKQKMVFIVI